MVNLMGVPEDGRSGGDNHTRSSAFVTGWDRVSAYSGLSNRLYTVRLRVHLPHPLEYSHVEVIRSRFVLSVLM